VDFIESCGPVGPLEQLLADVQSHNACKALSQFVRQIIAALKDDPPKTGRACKKIDGALKEIRYLIKQKKVPKDTATDWSGVLIAIKTELGCSSS
jgi:hypothetical protein